MDLSRLVNNDAPSQQTSPEAGSQGALQYAQRPVAQTSTAYASADQRPYQSYGQPSRQPSSGTTLSRPSDFADAHSYPPTLNTGVPSLRSHTSASSSPYPTYQPSPYTAHQAATTSRRSSNERFPATPSQLQPPQYTYPPTHSPSASSQHSFTPQSTHHSPLPALQHGVNPTHYQASYGTGLPPLPQTRASHIDAGSSPQQYRQPLGPPPLPQSPVSRRSSEQHAGLRIRAQSASISPKSLPPQPSLSREASQNSSSYFGVNGHSTGNSHFAPPSNHSHSASPAPLITSGPNDRPTFRRSHTMEMKHLLTPSTETPPQLPSSAKSDVRSTTTTTTMSSDSQNDVERESKKRALDDNTTDQRPAKKERVRRHLERPPWAIYSAKNPRGSNTVARNHLTQQTTAQPRLPVKPANGVNHTNTPKIDFDRPWCNALPYDMDLIHAREVLGTWEKSMRWNTPYPDTLRAVQDWLMHNLQDHRDVLLSPELATIEIEAKIGRLVRPDTGARAALPVLNMAVLAPNVNREHRFESALELDDFKNVNKFLNDSLASSKAPGRHGMLHERVKETDSFLDLSSAGLAILPDSLKRTSQHGRGLSLRTTTNAAGETTARIVKVSIADLHIFNPSGYDCRISMNAEVNYLRDNITADSVSIEPTDRNPAQPSRRKDRISYKHLAYQVDLTTVHVAGMPPKYEIEVEVDAQVLSQQIRLMSDGKPHAFSDVVSGFIDNATFLMRQQPQVAVQRG